MSVEAQRILYNSLTLSGSSYSMKGPSSGLKNSVLAYRCDTPNRKVSMRYLASLARDLDSWEAQCGGRKASPKLFSFTAAIYDLQLLRLIPHDRTRSFFFSVRSLIFIEPSIFLNELTVPI